MNVESIYQQFLTLVAEGRELSTAQVDDIAQGRIWTGRQAKQLGLVDELGDLNAAMAAAAKLAGLADYDVKPVEQDLGFPERILKQLAQRADQLQTRWFRERRQSGIETSIKLQIKALAERFGLLALPEDPGGLYLQCLECQLF